MNATSLTTPRRRPASHQPPQASCQPSSEGSRSAEGAKIGLKGAPGLRGMLRRRDTGLQATLVRYRGVIVVVLLPLLIVTVFIYSSPRRDSRWCLYVLWLGVHSGIRAPVQHCSTTVHTTVHARLANSRVRICAWRGNLITRWCLFSTSSSAPLWRVLQCHRPNSAACAGGQAQNSCASPAAAFWARSVCPQTSRPPASSKTRHPFSSNKAAQQVAAAAAGMQWSLMPAPPAAASTCLNSKQGSSLHLSETPLSS